MASTFQKVADLLPEPMALVSSDGVLIEANAALLSLVGTDGHTPVGRSLAELGWSSPEGWPDYLRLCARTRSFVVGAATLSRTNGSEISCRCEGALFEPRTSDGAAAILLRFLPKASSSSRFVALTQKIGELSGEIARRQRAEQEARDQRELLHVTLSSIGDAVIATDRDGRVTFMNDVAEQLTGWSGAAALMSAIGDVFQIVNEDTREPVENPVAKVMALGQIVGLANHTVLIGRDGAEHPIDDSGAPIVDASGRLHGVVLVFRDVTELRRAERREAAARQAAEAANRAKDEFLATLSHELRTPLNAVLGWTRMLRWSVLDDSRRAHALDVIERNAAMQARLIEDLLEVSRIMVGQLRLDHQPVRLAPIIDAALDAVRPAAENKSLRLSSSVRTTATVHGDAARLQQVIWNLLTNAVKFTPPHGSISIEAYDTDGREARIVVKDTGEGFPDSFHAHLFDAFSQADASFARPHGGLGLGLTLVRRLVEAHGGTVHAESPGLNQGATFTITLPLGSRAVAATSSPAPQAPPGDLRGVRVLVVEDHADSAELTRTVLEAAGGVVTTCTTAREALETATREHFDLLIADIGLPGDDGLWLIQRIRQLSDSTGGRIPAVALSAFAAARDRQAALASGYDEHVAKPLDPAALVAIVGRLRSRLGSR